MTMNREKVLLIFVVSVIIIASVLYMSRDYLIAQIFGPTKSNIESGISKENTENDMIEIVARRLDIPWGIAFLPKGDLLVTERSGQLLRIGDNEQTFTINGVRSVGEGGLLGLALHPDFEQNNWIYLYFTTDGLGGLVNRVDRYELKDDQLSNREIIIGDIPGARNHDGGQIAFGPDGYLYITTGDTGQPELAQDTNSLAGKILRVTEEGDIPSDNPFDNAVYSYGHRNSQGLAWDDEGRLWSVEHGRSGIKSGFDELNRIELGGNYGWPEIQGSETQEGMIAPVVHSGPDETWAPAGMTFVDGSLFFAGLRGSSLYQAKIINDSKVQLRAHFAGEYGRVRAVASKDNNIYFSTSNTDGRGTPSEEDDLIVRVSKQLLLNSQ